ncbi:MAG: ABC transporter substrate-binding protein [Gammaproteobacteria bacterium]|nr:ABC transporter substrate-binding protein [Gammaproteobacteria bacterium]
MINKTRITKILIILLLLFTSSCSKNDDSVKPLTIAINSWAGYSFALLADKLGYLNQNKTSSIKFIHYPSLSDSKRAYIDGNVDGMFSTLYEMVDAISYEHKKPKVIMITNISNGADKILAKKDYLHLNDLKNKPIAVEQNSIGSYMLSRALTQHQLLSKDYIIKYMHIDKMKQALINDEIAAVVSYSPHLNTLLSYAPNTVFHSGLMEDEILDILVIDEPIIASHFEQIKIILKGWNKAYQYYLKNPEKATKILQQITELKEVNLQKDLQGIKIVDYSQADIVTKLPDMLEKSFQLMMSTQSQRGGISRNLSVQDIVYQDLFKLYQ